MIVNPVPRRYAPQLKANQRTPQSGRVHSGLRCDFSALSGPASLMAGLSFICLFKHIDKNAPHSATSA